MLTFPGSLKVFISMDPADLRKSFTGLWALTVNVLKDDPSSGSLYVFTNRRRNRVKILYWDGTGLWIMAKRLEQGRFCRPRGLTDGEFKLTLKPEALEMLLSGIDLKHGMQRAWYELPD